MAFCRSGFSRDAFIRCETKSVSRLKPLLPISSWAYNERHVALGIPMTESVRLAKRVVALTQCSRREAEQYIEGGWVTVDGVVVEKPQHMITDEQVSIDPYADLAPTEPMTLALHKPAGMDAGTAAGTLITAANHWMDDASGVRPLQRHLMRLGMPLGLPHDASGLLLLTQDWRVTRRLGEDLDRIELEFVVDVQGRIADNGLARLHHGLSHHHYALPPVKVSWQSEQKLRFAFKKLDPARIPWMCETVGLEVTAMKCLRIGRIPLAKLPVGQWRYLAPGDRI
jgi:23S rRNA pseudouridine2604 synthase